MCEEKVLLAAVLVLDGIIEELYANSPSLQGGESVVDLRTRITAQLLPGLVSEARNLPGAEVGL